MMKRNKAPGITLFFILLLILTTALRAVLSVFPKTAVTYNDELFYLELAQNIFLRGSLTVYGSPIHFTKLLYPLVLSPFYSVSDGMLRTQLISLFNALLLSSSLIPGYLLARRMLKKNWQVIFSLLLLAFSPNLLFSLTFMSENLYIPLLLWGFYAAYRFFSSEEKKPLHACFLGFLAFLLYLTKETGAAWAAAIAAALFMEVSKNKKDRRKALLLPVSFLAGLLVPFLFTRFILLRGISYSYSEQASMSYLTGPGQMMYILYAGLAVFVYFLVSVLWFPAALPVLNRKNLSGPNRCLLLISCVYIILIALGIAFGVSLSADYPQTDLRIHLRYFAGAAFPVFLLCFAALENTDPQTDKKPLWVTTILFGALILLLTVVPRSESLVDLPVLHFVRLLDRNEPLWQWLFRMIPVIFAIPVLLLWNRKRKQIFVCLLLPLLLVCSFFSDYAFVTEVQRTEKVTDEARVAEIRLLDKYLDSVDGGILVVADSPTQRNLLIMNTCMNDDYYFTQSETLLDLCATKEARSAGLLDLSTPRIPDPLYSFSGQESYNIQRIDRIITLGDYAVLDPEMNEDVTPEGLSFAHVYQAQDPSVLALVDPLAYITGEDILFYSEGEEEPGFLAYQPTGFYPSETTLTWSRDNEATLTLRPDIVEPADLRAVWNWRLAIGDQHCQVLANDTPVLDAIISGTNDYIYFTIPAEAYADYNGLITLRFLFPDACQPGNGDARTLAVAFESIMIAEK